MNKCPGIEEAVLITTASNPLSGVPCQIYRLYRTTSNSGLVQITDGAGGPLKYSETPGNGYSVDFNPVPLVFTVGPELTSVINGSLTAYVAK